MFVYRSQSSELKGFSNRVFSMVLKTYKLLVSRVVVYDRVPDGVEVVNTVSRGIWYLLIVATFVTLRMVTVYLSYNV